jgi:hypothetical protein
LSVTSDSGGELSREADGFVEGVGVERLGSSENSRHRFDSSTDNIVIGVLLSKRPSRSLAMST